jgi:hypothetical protein
MDIKEQIEQQIDQAKQTEKVVEMVAKKRTPKPKTRTAMPRILRSRKLPKLKKRRK